MPRSSSPATASTRTRSAAPIPAPPTPPPTSPTQGRSAASSTTTGSSADGNHGFIPATWPPTMTPEDSARFRLELEFASILGMPHMGTGGDPTGSSLQGRLGHRRRQVATRWARSPGPTASSSTPTTTTPRTTSCSPTPGRYDSRRPSDPGRRGVRKLEYFLKVTDPRYVWLQMDIYWAHVAQHRFRTYTAPNGQTLDRHLRPGGARRREYAALPAVPREGRPGAPTSRPASAPDM